MFELDMSSKENFDKRVKIFSILIPLIPFLDVYELGFAPISFGEILLILFIICSYNKHLYISNNIYGIFIIYAFTSSLVLNIMGDYFLFSDWFFKWVRVAIYTYTFLILAPRYISIKLLSKYFSIFGLIASLIQIIQSIMWYLSKKMVLFIIPFLKLHYNISNYSDYVKNIMGFNGTAWRPSGLFLEPSGFALYAIIVLILCLCFSKKVRIKTAIVVSISILLCLSSFGIIMAVIVWVYWAYKVNRNKRVIYVLIITFILLMLSTNSIVLNSVLYRLNTIGEEGSTTGSLRLLRGIAVFSQLPVIQKIFGVGLGNLDTYLIQNNISTIYDNELKPGSEYMNTISYILVNTGVIGFSLFLSFVLSLFNAYRQYAERLLIISWLIICITNLNFLNIGYILPLLVIEGIKRDYV